MPPKFTQQQMPMPSACLLHRQPKITQVVPADYLMRCPAPPLQDADHYWQLTPPAQQGLLGLLNEEGVAIRWANPRTPSQALPRNSCPWSGVRAFDSGHTPCANSCGPALTVPAALPSPPTFCSFGWGVERDNPPPSIHGGPRCSGSIMVPLAGSSKQALLEVVQVGFPPDK